MIPFTGFQAGVNLGGWISQYHRYDHGHFKSFITQADIQKIASWGMDHVRLPFDYPVLEDDAEPFHYKESGLSYLDACLEWCEAAGLNLILDLHRAPGYAFYTLAENALFSDAQLQERFLALWEMLAERYRERQKVKIVLELMNEMVLPDSAPWNDLAHRAIHRIRVIDSERWIMYGGNNYNSAHELKNITLVDDPHIVYTFHYYEPMPFTHQRASWVPELVALNQPTPYPGSVPGVDEFLQEHPEFNRQLAGWKTRKMNRDYLREKLQPALDFLQKTGLPLYCGEYGAIDTSDLPSRIRWHRDFTGLLSEHNIGKAVWSYKEMNFSMVWADGQEVSRELIEIVSRP
jgi:endoglucanase